MNKKQFSFVSMTKGVLVHFGENESAWGELEVVREVVEEISAQVALVENPSQKQEEGTSAHTANKDALFDTMIDKVFKLKLKLTSYARHKKDLFLLQSIDYSKSALESGSEAEAVVRCKFVLQKAKDNFDKLGLYKVTQPELDEVAKAIAEFEKAPALRNIVGSEAKTATATIEAIVEQLRDNFDTLDDFTYGLIEDPHFVAMYRNLRQIKDKGGRGSVEPSEN